MKVLQWLWFYRSFTPVFLNSSPHDAPARMIQTLRNTALNCYILGFSTFTLLQDKTTYLSQYLNLETFLYYANTSAISQLFYLSH